jgi:hypothetical protein
LGVVGASTTEASEAVTFGITVKDQDEKKKKRRGCPGGALAYPKARRGGEEAGDASWPPESEVEDNGRREESAK